MTRKPITLARHDYMQGIVALTNQSGLPAFVMVDVLEQAARELRPLMDAELKKAKADWQAAQAQEETTDEKKGGVTHGEENQGTHQSGRTGAGRSAG